MKIIEVYKRLDLEITKGKGCFVWDKSGTQYLDMFGGHAVISVGHTHPHYVSEVSRQLNLLGFYSNSVRISIQEQIADKLGKISGKENYNLFLCNSGAEANENALKLASYQNGRKKVVAFTGSFHGRTSLTAAATNISAIAAPVNETTHVIFLPHNDLNALEATFSEMGNEISSVIIEGIQGVSGIHISQNEFLQKIRRLCDQYGAYLIADAIQCGYGRTGSFFSHDYSGINADIYTLAKGMGNGFPVAGLMINPLFKSEYGSLGTTFGGNPLACSAALAVLNIIEEERLIENANLIGNYLLKELRKFNNLKEVRGRGLMIGIETVDEFENIRTALINKHHIITGEAKPNVIRLLPPLNFTYDHADLFLTALEKELA